MSEKLSDTKRQQIRQSAMADAYENQFKQARKKLAVLCVQAHTAITKKYPFDKIPEAFYHKETWFRLQFPRVAEQRTRTIDFHDYMLEGTNSPTGLDRHRFITTCGNNWFDLSIYKISDTLLKKLAIADDHLTELLEKRRILDQRIYSILESVNTSKQLIEIWPEAANYLPVIPSTGKALTICVNDVIKELKAAKQ